MKIRKLLLDLLVNGTTLYLLFISFLNIDLMKMYQALILSAIIINVYLINRKVLRKEECDLGWKQVVVAIGIGIANFFLLFVFKKMFF